MAAVERRFRAMGSACDVMVVGGSEALADAALARIDDLERRWSRFRADSELSLLNGMAGSPIVVSPETFELVAKAVYAWEATGGAFDPTVLPALLAAGYDRSFEHLGRRSAPRRRAIRAPGCCGIVLAEDLQAVTLPAGVALDPGGIGKGLAGDIVVRELLAAGAAGAMVNLGGDVRAAGAAPEGDGWTVAVEDPFHPGAELTRVRISDGAVATSSRLLRTWERAGERMHHLIDPATGEPLAGTVATVTVVAGEGWWAEAMTKVAFAAGVEDGPGRLVNAAALFVDDSGRRVATPGFGEEAHVEGGAA